ncbi:MAG: hypothetical protein HOV68_33165 [Streptomycetaceae bacterium]|nr:hypothetical protein [Streptomycetaceae bacterium]
MANPGTTVAGITVAALLGVGALAWRASDTAPDDRQAAITSSAPVSSSGGAPPSSTTPARPAVPANSGTGKRVVYSVSKNMVWLVDVVDSKEASLREYGVVAGTVPIPADEYRVKTKTVGPQRGGDGLTIANTVVIGTLNGMTLGFSGTETPLDQVAANNAPETSASTGPSGTSTRRPTGKTTGPTPRSSTSAKPRNAGVRETIADSRALFEFVDIGTLVVVVA